MKIRIVFGVFLSVGLLLLYLWLIFFSGTEHRSFNEFHWIEKIIFVWGFGGGGILWVWMMSDLFVNQYVKHKVVWGWVLLIFNWIIVIPYFLFVYIGSVNKREDF